MTSRYGTAVARAWDRVHPRLTHRSAWLDHDGPLPVIEGPDPPAGGSPARRPTPSRCGCGLGTGAAPAEVDRLWQAFLRRFDLEHTFRLFKQVLGWTAPKIRDPDAADRWTWLIITAHAQLRLARPSLMTCACPGNAPRRRAADPGPRPPGFRNIRATLPARPVHRNPANPAPAARRDRRTAAPHPATTWEKRPEENARSRHGANAQVKRAS